MTKFAQAAALCLSSLFLLPWNASAQAVPAALGPRFFQGFAVPVTAGTLHYSLNASERLLYGYVGTNGTVSQTTLSGDVGYLSGSETAPFSLLYSGGYLIDTYGQPSSFFHGLNLTQAILRRHWNLQLSDSFHYLPETPTTGLSGLLGVGNPGVPTTGTGGQTGQGILTNYATRIENTADATLGIPVTGATSLVFGGADEIMRFPYVANAIESDRYTGSAGVSHRVDARNLVTAGYDYTRFEFLGFKGAFVTQDFLAGYTRHWSRKVLTHVVAGPQIVDSSSLTGVGQSLNYSADVEADYLGDASTFVAGYTRSTNSGFGVTYGARNDTARLTANHKISRQLTGAAALSYSHNQNLTVISRQTFETSAFVASVQVHRAFTEKIDGFASYSVEHQGITGLPAGVTPLNGLLQIVGFGVSYSPRPLRIGHH